MSGSAEKENTGSSREKPQRSHILAEFGKDALRATDLQRLLDQAVLRVSQAIDVSHTKIMRYRPETADLLVVAGSGWHEGIVGNARLRIDLDSPAGRALQTGQPINVEDLPHSREFRVPALLAEHGVISASNVPIMFDSGIWGVLEVDSDSPRSFTAEDTDYLRSFAGFLGAAIERHNSEIHLSSLASAEAAALAQSDILLHELQHRMKNVLQTILSIVSLQRRKVGETEARDALSHIAERVTAISLAQDQLSMSQHLRHVDFASYLRALCAHIEPGRDNIAIEVKTEDANLTVEQAVPAGLIVNEAVTNSVKHAFPTNRGGTIVVTFRLDAGRRRAVLRIADNGQGISSQDSQGSGRELMGALATQIGGELEILPSSAGGTVVSVDFPLGL